jgi:hypothetical protein
VIVTPTSKELDFLASDLVRSPGLHASDIYGDLYKRLDPKRYDYGDKPPNPLALAMGTAWERHVEYLLKKNGVDCYRPDELLSPEGVAFSPDLIIYNGVVRVGEIKWTSMSADGCPEEETTVLPAKLDKYLTQIKLYAYWLELYDGWLSMLFMHQAWNPQHRAYNLHWTQRELVENYMKCMNHAEDEGML